MDKLQQLVVIKIQNDTNFIVCGYYNNIDDAETYINEVLISVTQNFQSQYAGEYIILPCFYFKIM